MTVKIQEIKEVKINMTAKKSRPINRINKQKEIEQKKRKRKKKPGHRFLKEECQLALLSFSKAGAKVRTLKHNFQMFRKFFFHFSFPRPKFRKKPMAKKRKMEAYRSVLLSECQNIAAFVPESGCKSSAFTDICKIYTSFF